MFPSLLRPSFRPFALACLLGSGAQAGSDEQVRHVYFSSDGQRVLVAFEAHNDFLPMDDQGLKVLDMQSAERWNVRAQHALVTGDKEELPASPDLLLTQFWPLLAPPLRVQQTARIPARLPGKVQ